MLASESELNKTILNGIEEVKNIFEGVGVDNPAEPILKKCLRCIKKGRAGFYPLDDFSVLKNGKRHSQCKVCRTEQAMEWDASQREKRREYHRLYHKRRKPANRTPSAIKILLNAADVENTKPQPQDAMFVTFTKDSKVKTTEV
jgi:hypothetical protein